MTSANNSENLARNAANFVPLTPISFLHRAKDVYPDREAVIHGKRRYTWRELHQRASRLARALLAIGIKRGQTVAVIAANTPEMVEAHFGVPMAGAVLNTINFRLDAESVAYILDHGEARALITDAQFAPMVRAALSMREGPNLPIVDILDEELPHMAEKAARLGEKTYEEFLAEAPIDGDLPPLEDEWDAIALNYTSGTSGRPKGVIYHHRGSYLMTLGTVAGWGLPAHPRYLYCVPMFHCNGWGHAWTMAAVAGTIVCCRQVSARAIFEAIEKHGITHFGGAPVVLGMIVNAPENERKKFDWPIKVLTAGSPPPASILEKMEALGFDVMQVYGLTETYGHTVHCAWQDEWSTLSFGDRAKHKARQGVRFPITEAVRVADSATGEEVPSDGKALGEVQIRGNTVMKGYLKNEAASAEAFAGGWFHSGDLAVMHENGYIEIKDRIKDIIISGGENVSSVEVEGVLYRHPAVALAAVVAIPDERWGEVPCAVVELKPGANATESEIISFCRDRLSGFKTPKRVVFEELPKTATGKIQKFMLRQSVRSR
jgi:fatty-acyl-CoA synthase